MTAQEPAAPPARPAVAAPAPSRPEALNHRHSSCEETLRLDQRLRKTVHLLACIVERERGAAGGAHAEAGKQRHNAMSACPHGDAGTVDNGRHIVRMRAFDLERDNRPLLPRGPEDAQRIDLA